MSINLRKGQKIDLTKQDGLDEIMVGLGWDEAQASEDEGFHLFKKKKEETPIDCDASVILLNEESKLYGERKEDHLVFFNSMVHPSGAIVHQGDNRTGEGEGDDEQIFMQLKKIPSGIAHVVFVVNIYDAREKGQHFGMIKNAFIRLVDLRKKEEICRFDLNEDYTDMTGLVAGEIYRKGGVWKFGAIGQPLKEASRLQSIMDLYR